LFTLWEASLQKEIEDQILVTSIIEDLDNFSQYIRLVNRKNEEYDRFELRTLYPEDTIQWMEKLVERINEFFHCLSATENQKNKLSLILGNLMNEIKYLRCFNKSYDNDRSTIWFAQWISWKN
jgi:hypothetical protein